MKKLVKVQIYKDKDQRANNSFEITGRLLGVASIMEATKILQNAEVGSRIATAETKSLRDTIDAVESPNQDSKDMLTRVVVAIKEIKRMTDKMPLTTLTRQLFISAPISLVSEIVQDHKKETLKKATMDCSDNSLLVIEELEE